MWARPAGNHIANGFVERIGSVHHIVRTPISAGRGIEPCISRNGHVNAGNHAGGLSEDAAWNGRRINQRQSSNYADSLRVTGETKDVCTGLTPFSVKRNIIPSQSRFPQPAPWGTTGTV